MKKVISKDGMTIALEQSGTGPAVILVDGAMAYRELLAEDLWLPNFPKSLR
jgi:hypothetical protein